MAKLKGKIGYSDLEGGFWTLEGEDGKRYKLEGGDKALQKKGLKVEIDGTVEEGGMGIGFGAPILNVKSHKTL
jgi:hypothetical protein